ncbi:hypothetical protein RHGRI_002360 [Rhododendron griersonianum]|uniref:Uncharacterized protein n=1 Tax=Rhododendron griersonianum TaxID=479676 RepID=A0AAV6LPW5_9ERIC|nr:hypothetical protein RHGRI_002360 [Rhododendron griersonianum]
MSKEPSVPEECYEFLFLASNALGRVFHEARSVGDKYAVPGRHQQRIPVRASSDGCSDLEAIRCTAQCIEIRSASPSICHLVVGIFRTIARGSMNDDVWSTFIRVGVAAILKNRVAPAEKIQALILAESVMSMVGEGWLIGRMNLSNAEDPVPADMCMLLVLESSRVEVAVLLNDRYF